MARTYRRANRGRFSGGGGGGGAKALGGGKFVVTKGGGGGSAAVGSFGANARGRAAGKTTQKGAFSAAKGDFNRAAEIHTLGQRRISSNTVTKAANNGVTKKSFTNKDLTAAVAKTAKAQSKVDKLEGTAGFSIVRNSRGGSSLGKIDNRKTDAKRDLAGAQARQAKVQASVDKRATRAKTPMTGGKTIAAQAATPAGKKAYTSPTVAPKQVKANAKPAAPAKSTGSASTKVDHAANLAAAKTKFGPKSPEYRRAYGAAFRAGHRTGGK